MARENVGQNDLAAQIGYLKGELAEGNSLALNYQMTEDMGAGIGALIRFANVIARASLLQVEILATPLEEGPSGH